MKGLFDIVRKKQPKVKRGAMVLYKNRPYHIASTDGNHLVLRSTIRVHPCDDDLVFDDPEDQGESECN